MRKNIPTQQGNKVIEKSEEKLSQRLQEIEKQYREYIKEFYRALPAVNQECKQGELTRESYVAKVKTVHQQFAEKLLTLVNPKNSDNAVLFSKKGVFTALKRAFQRFKELFLGPSSNNKYRLYKDAISLHSEKVYEATTALIDTASSSTAAPAA